MEVTVIGNFDHALAILKRRINASGLGKEIRVRAFPKRSERLRFKKRLATQRRQRAEARRDRWRLR